MEILEKICEVAFTLWGWWLWFSIVMVVLIALIIIVGYGAAFLYIAHLFGG